MAEETGMICVSRPTNPTGNVITDEELLKLDALANQHGIPLVIDNAYGVPFPGIIFSEARPLWKSEYRAVHESFQAGAAWLPAAALSSPMKKSSLPSPI
ncbi:class I and II aminotransferase [Escherichia coli]|uniref:Class I and II aminotransferase n=1 Tax=Escherichia coli TaxID=562 RepID=A0A2X3JXY5_ECOLX|nr:class I and II aminotransferase [Escherichia coli]